MDIGENEFKSEAAIGDITSNIKDVNLVEKFGINQCKLCFSEFTNYHHLKRHNEGVHKDDQEAMDLTLFTLKDLKNSCNMCPLGFLTENILIDACFDKAWMAEIFRQKLSFGSFP